MQIEVSVISPRSAFPNARAGGAIRAIERSVIFDVHRSALIKRIQCSDDWSSGKGQAGCTISFGRHVTLFPNAHQIVAVFCTVFVLTESPRQDAQNENCGENN